MAVDKKPLTNEQLKPYIDAAIAERRQAEKKIRRDVLISAVGIITYYGLLSFGILSGYAIFNKLAGA